MGRSWTDEEIGILQSTFHLPAEQVGEQLGRSVKAIGMARHKARRDLLAVTRASWTEAEDEILTAHGQGISPSALRPLLPGRTTFAITTRRKQLGIAGPKGQRYSPLEPGKRTLLAKTCPSCGELFAGRAFPSNGRGCKAVKCRWCSADNLKERRDGDAEVSRKVRALKQRIQSITLEQATRTGEPYTESDHKVLANPYLTHFQKALALNRTYYAINGACKKAGYQSREAMGPREVDRWSIDNPNASHIDEITASLKQEFETAGVPFPAWDWDDEDLEETA